jgi:phage/plasmid primase-like uncharacterized protein
LRHNRDNDLSDRHTAASVAKAALLAAYRTAKDAAGPEHAAKQAERQAIAAAREERRAERERLKAEALERKAADDAAASDRGESEHLLPCNIMCHPDRDEMNSPRVS